MTTTTSPFNITAEALTLAAFTRADIDDLLEQHTAATGQVFLDEARDAIEALTEGHPWLVNALADQIVDRDVQDRAVPVTAAHVEAAKETILLERRTHIDSLIARLHEPRVRKMLGEREGWLVPFDLRSGRGREGLGRAALEQGDRGGGESDPRGGVLKKSPAERASRRPRKKS